MSNELNPCPFCGYDLRESNFIECMETELEPDRQKNCYRIKCPSCGSCGGRQWTEKRAVAAWNKRTS